MRILITVAGGGFFWQSRAVARGLSEGFELHYATVEPAHVWANAGLPPGVFHELPGITTQGERAWTRKAANFMSNALRALRVVREVNPDAIVCIASSVAVPLCLWGKLLKKETVFIESITRVSHPSTTGKIIDRLRLCDRFYVQWPEAMALYKRAVYRGTVL